MSFDFHSILVDPTSREPLKRGSDGRLQSRNGMTFACVDTIPILLAHHDDTPHYQSHYTIDALEFDYFEERDAATEHDEHRLRQTIIRHMNSAQSAQLVLDVGCGRAWVARELCPMGHTVCSLDVSLTNPQKALSQYPFPNHHAVVADAMALPFPDNTFDCVIASEIIEHVLDPAAFVKELFRVVKPGGRLLVSTPYKEKLRYVLCVHCNQKTPLHAHIHSFDEHVLRGFVNTSVANVRWTIFGNKALLLLRSYVVLRILPYPLWRFVDSVTNLLLNRCSHIVVTYIKS